MYLVHHWNVLVVDDEPDVLAVTRLALKNMTIFGVPLRLEECTSGAQAVSLLNSRATAQAESLIVRGGFSLAIIDVVMESDHAGLDLCAYIREKLKNRAMQLVLRTGQAGMAPERDVADRCDVSTYLTKGRRDLKTVCISLWKNCVLDNSLWSVWVQSMYARCMLLIEAADSKDRLSKDVPDGRRESLQ